MKLGMTPENLLRYTKLCTYLTLCWPPLDDVAYFKILVLEILFFISFSSTILLLIPLFISIYRDSGDPVTFTKSICFSCTVAFGSGKILVNRIQRRRFKAVLLEMMTFLKKADNRQKEVLQNYTDEFAILHLLIITVGYLTASACILAPFFTSISFPTDAKYPFAVDASYVKFIIYLHQSIVAYQVASAMAVDCLLATLLWFTAARFKSLANDFKIMRNEADIQNNIQNHQHLLRCAKNLRNVVRLSVCDTIVFPTLGSIFSGTQLFTKESFSIKVQFAFIVISSMAILFVTAWPAEHLIITSTEIGDAVYHSPWVELPARLIKNLIFVIKVSQEPIIISVEGILPQLCLRYYSQFISTIFSYLATMRAFMSSAEMEMQNEESSQIIE